MMYKKQMKKIFVLSVVLFSLTVGVTQAATTSKTIWLPWDVKISPEAAAAFDGLALPVPIYNAISLPWNWSKIKINVNKKVKLVRENGNTIGDTDFTLKPGKSISLSDEAPYGNWTWAGHTRNLGVDFTIENTLSKANQIVRSYNVTNRVTTPRESGDLDLVSKNPNIVECSGNSCTALKGGTAKITVRLRDTQQTAFDSSSLIGITIDSLGGDFWGDKSGYGKIKTVTAYQRSGTWSGKDGNQKTIAYSLPNITYTVTVPEEDDVNSEQVSACAGYSNIKDTSAVVKWSYTDVDNDPQTNYQVQVSEKSDFSSLAMNVMAPSNTDVSSVRQRTVIYLEPETKYYGRVRTYNEENGWSAYSYCESFTTNPATEQPPVDNPDENGACSNVVETCSAGTLQHVDDSDTQYLWNCVGETSTDNCAIDKSTYSGSINGKCNNSLKYACYKGDSTVNREEGEGNFYWTCEGINGGDDDEGCYLLLNGCVGEGCPNVGIEAAIIDFRFSPFIANDDNYCPLYLEAENVTSCELISTGNAVQVNIYPDSGETSIFEEGSSLYPVGEYRVSCVGTDGETVSKYGARCISNPGVIEN